MITQGTRQRELTFSAATHEIELDCSKLVEVNRPGYGKRTLQVVGDQVSTNPITLQKELKKISKAPQC